MLTSSCKAKGRRAAQRVKDLILSYSEGILEDGDIIVTSSGETGEDLKLSPRAKEMYPFSIECKNQEKLNIWSAMAQAITHCKDDTTKPVLFYQRNHSDLYVSLRAEDFIWLIS